jgi:outer membrane biosynthesis protein TonB
MRNRTFRLINLLVAATFSMNLSGAELTQVDFNGMQLAWVLVPSTSTSKEATEVVKPKPKPVAAPAATPVQPPVAKPVQPPASKSAPAVKPVPVPLSKPVQVPASKPAQVVVAKPAQASVKKEVQAIEWIIGLGMDFGGEELGKLYYTDGSSASVKANNGIAINAGAIIANGKNSPFSTQITLGYKFGGPRGDGGDVTWSAIPLEVIEYYRTNNIRTGLGISYQIRPQLSVNLPASSYTDTYNNAIGFIAQIGWAPVREHYSVDLRYTSIKFQLSGVQDAPMVDGSVAGLYASYRF